MYEDMHKSDSRSFVCFSTNTKINIAHNNIIIMSNIITNIIFQLLYIYTPEGVKFFLQTIL